MSNLFEHSRAGVSKTKLKIRISREQSKIYLPQRTNAASCPIKDFNDLNDLKIPLPQSLSLFFVYLYRFTQRYETDETFDCQNHHNYCICNAIRTHHRFAEFGE